MSRMNCQMFSTGLSSGARGGSGRKVILDFEGQGGVPSGLIEHDDGMGAGFNDAADFGKMSVQRLRVGVGHDKAGGLVRADGAKDIGRGRPLVLGR